MKYALSSNLNHSDDYEGSYVYVIGHRTCLDIVLKTYKNIFSQNKKSFFLSPALKQALACDAILDIRTYMTFKSFRKHVNCVKLLKVNFIFENHILVYIY